jgi:Small, acid-soluble spore proteins, alpha/beta type
MVENSSSNQLVIQNAAKALFDLKYEVASELGITPPTDGYWGMKTSYENGSIGGSITKRLVTFAQEHLANQEH